MEFIIDPYVGAGSILLGMTSQQIQNALSAKPEKFRKFEDDDFDTDAFDWCHVYYKNPGVCEAIEFFKPAKIIFKGQNLLGQSFENVKKLFLEHDKSLELDDSGLTSYKYGVGIYAPYAIKTPTDPIEGVIVFEKGYYD